MHPDSDMKIFTPKQPETQDLTRLQGEPAESDAKIPIWNPAGSAQICLNE